MTTDEKYMHRCLQLAEPGKGYVAPNPMVGAVLICGEKIIGEGYHKIFGEEHAEVNCINSVSEQDKSMIEKSILYVSLEPCVHYGKTPPCTDLIIKSKIPKVVIGSRDVFKKVNGKGIQKLQAEGVEVIVGVLEKECIQLNKRFFTFQEKQRPYIILKWAQSIDGKIAGANSERSFITNEFTNRLVHKWRSEETSIIVGTNTALLDDPSLTTRLWQGKNPIRLIFDMNLRLPSSLKIFNKQVKTIIFNKIKHEEKNDLIFYKLETGNILEETIKALHEMNIQSIIVEGGAKLLKSFINAGLWDEARLICNEQLNIGNGVNSPAFNGVLQKQERYFSDVISYYNNPEN
jgi:diaminohydroxyphosphoribosylaminopyrimidine deaminase/5-amino-6-(5-phosphoribosylamino)uracil reductase